jgi:hypothetical protein
MIHEETARQQIDLLLQQSGWIVQDRSQTNLVAGPGVAIREALLKTGELYFLPRVKPLQPLKPSLKVTPLLGR